MAKKNTGEKFKKKSRVEFRPSTEFVVVAKELELAYDRVGSAPAQRLRWLLEFAGLDLDALSKGRYADLGWEWFVFGLNKKRDQLRNSLEVWDVLTSLQAWTIEDEVVEEHIPVFSTPSRTLMSEFHSMIRGIFDTLFKGEYWEFTRPSPLERIALRLSLHRPEELLGWRFSERVL